MCRLIIAVKQGPGAYLFAEGDVSDAILETERMLALMTGEDRWELSLPSKLDVGVWHTAILDTRHYRAFCHRACRKYEVAPSFVEHDVLAGGVGTIEKRRENLRRAYRDKYGVDPAAKFWEEGSASPVRPDRASKKRKRKTVPSDRQVAIIVKLLTGSTYSVRMDPARENVATLKRASFF